MAREGHLRILEQGVQTWNAWRDEVSTVTPDLQGAVLRRAHLEGATLPDGR